MKANFKFRIFALFLLFTFVATQTTQALTVNMLLVVDDELLVEQRNQFQSGAQLGVDEGNIQGKFLGLAYTLTVHTAAQLSHADFSTAPAAVIVAGDATLLQTLQQRFAAQRTPIFNVALEDDALRAMCHPSTFHTVPSKKMQSDAIAQWQQGHQDSTAQALAWHSQFMKFAGRDLNKRYTESFSLAMDSNAWAAWAATRSVAEAVVRTNNINADDLATFLRESLVFDGQKGVSLSFRQNGQLRQPLLIVVNDKLVGEAPVRGVAKDTELDSLGDVPCSQ
jgi:hypothetical protein